MRETQIGSNLIDRLASLGLLNFNIFRQYVGLAKAMVPRNFDTARKPRTKSIDFVWYCVPRCAIDASAKLAQRSNCGPQAREV